MYPTRAKGGKIIITHTAAERAKAKTREYLLNDGGGLNLRIRANGSKTWIFRYTAGGIAHKETIGEFPAISLAAARAARDEMKSRIRQGLPPKDKPRKRATFAEIARRWQERRRAGGELADNHLVTVDQRLRRYLFPVIGARELESLSRVELVELVQSIAARGTIETAHRAAGIIGQVFKFAEDCGAIRAGGAVVALQLARILPHKQTEHFPMTANAGELGALLRAIDAYSGETVRAALLFVAYTMTRSGEARRARWKEIDTAAGLWTIPAEHMKRRRVHKVPLSRQALSILEYMRPRTFAGGDSLIFHHTGKEGRGRVNVHGGILSDAALLRPLQEAAKRGAAKMTVHGFRAAASTVLNSQRWDKELIELQLSHLDKDRIRAMYNHAERLDERRELLQAWADWLDAQRQGRAVVAVVLTQERTKTA